MDSTQEKIIARVAMARPITIEDLFRHTSGVICGNRGDIAVHKMGARPPADERGVGRRRRTRHQVQEAALA